MREGGGGGVCDGRRVRGRGETQNRENNKTEKNKY